MDWILRILNSFLSIWKTNKDLEDKGKADVTVKAIETVNKAKEKLRVERERRKRNKQSTTDIDYTLNRM